MHGISQAVVVRVLQGTQGEHREGRRGVDGYNQRGDGFLDGFHFDQSHFAVFFEELESFDRPVLREDAAKVVLACLIPKRRHASNVRVDRWRRTGCWRDGELLLVDGCCCSFSSLVS